MCEALIRGKNREKTGGEMGESVTVGLTFGGFADGAWDRLGYVSAMLIREILRVVFAAIG